LIQIVEDFGITLHDDEPVENANGESMPWGYASWGLHWDDERWGEAEVRESCWIVGQ
jgi:hypothetical protein